MHEHPHEPPGLALIKSSPQRPPLTFQWRAQALQSKGCAFPQHSASQCSPKQSASNSTPGCCATDAGEAGAMATHPDLSCTVCMHSFDVHARRPVDLGCGHTYCDACLLASPSSFRRCPECRAQATNPHVNYTVYRLLSSSSLGDLVNNAGMGAVPTNRAASQPSADAGSAPPGLQSLQVELSRGPGAHHFYSSDASSFPGQSLMGFIPGLQWLCTFLSNAWSEESSDVWQREERTRRGAAAPASAAPAWRPAVAPPERGRTAQSVRRSSSSARASRPSSATGTPALQDLPVALQEVRSTFWAWMGPLLGVLYMLSPLDLIPDFLPLVGWLDDMLVLGAIIYFVYSLVREQQSIRNALSAAAAAQHHS